MGYSNKVANEETKKVSKVLGGSFVDIGKDSIRLSELSFTGYQDSEDYQDAGTGSNFSLAKLSTGGAYEHQYVWKDSYKSGKWTGGYWYDSKTATTIVPGSDDDIEITRGDAFWCTIGKKWAKGDANMCLVSAGQVLVDSQGVVANNTTKKVSKAMCNPMPVSCRLSEVSFTGYQDSEDYQDAGTGSNFSLAKLSTGGAYEHQYVWKDSYKSGHWTGGYWYDSKTSTTIVPESADDIEIKPGEGFWCTIGKKWSNSDPNMILVWPKVEGLGK